MKPAGKRTLLGAKDAVDIYMMLNSRTRGLSSRLAKKYGVSPKTIRDIWNRTSWTESTSKYWGLTFATVICPDDLNRVLDRVCVAYETPHALWTGCVPPQDPFEDDYPYWVNE